MIEERIALAREQLEQSRDFDFSVENDDRERAADALAAIIDGQLRQDRYHGATVIHPRIDELLAQVDSRYALVIVAAKRARQINNYHHQLGESGFEDYAPPMVQSRSKNYLTMALEEVASGKLVYDYKKT